MDSRIFKTQWIEDHFGADSGLCLSDLDPTPNLDRRSFSSLGRYVNEFIQIISFFDRSSFKLQQSNLKMRLLLCEINNSIYIYQITFERLASVSGYGCGVGFEQKYWRIDGFGEKKARLGGPACPYLPPPPPSPQLSKMSSSI